MINKIYHYIYLNPTHSTYSISINGILFVIKIRICISVCVSIIIDIIIAPSARALIHLVLNYDTPAPVSLVTLSITLVVPAVAIIVAIVIIVVIVIIVNICISLVAPALCPIIALIIGSPVAVAIIKLI